MRVSVSLKTASRVLTSSSSSLSACYSVRTLAPEVAMRAAPVNMLSSSFVSSSSSSSSLPSASPPLLAPLSSLFGSPSLRLNARPRSFHFKGVQELNSGNIRLPREITHPHEGVYRKRVPVHTKSPRERLPDGEPNPNYIMDGTPLDELTHDQKRLYVPSGDRYLKPGELVRWPASYWWRPTSEEERNWFWATRRCGMRRQGARNRKPVIPAGKFPTFFRARKSILRRHGWDKIHEEVEHRIPPLKYIELHEKDMDMLLPKQNFSNEAPQNAEQTMVNARGETVVIPKVFRWLVINGRWQRPKFSKRRIATLRKETLMMGQEWPWEPATRAKVNYFGKEQVRLKGFKSSRKKFEKWLKIEENLKTMDERIEAYREKLRSNRRNTNEHESYLTPK